ncbi:MAG: molybdate ABC transporter permease subunit [Chitinivibrionales bacterium]|nr:molybdate ABC transporter permease subunit [Chitinivibrionales bacterium]
MAAVTTLILFMVCIPLAYVTARARLPVRIAVKTLANLPLILPPSVLGFYLLVTLAPSSFIGHLLEGLLHVRFVFTFAGLVIGSVLFSLPLMFNPCMAGFENLSPTLEEVSYTLGKSRTRTLFSVLLPSIRPSLLTGVAMAFAHTMGEFGVVLMIGGKIPGKTLVASVAIYDYVETLNFPAAHAHAALLLLVSCVILVTVYLVNIIPVFSSGPPHRVR